jgi:RNA polymerase sigma factor (sigma-70 family)
MQPVGHVLSPVTKQTDEGWGKVTSQIAVLPAYRAGLAGLDQFSHILVVTLLHEAAFNPQRHLIRRPRGLASMPEVGIFAQRAKDRPNPIGITAVRFPKAIEEFIGNVTTGTAAVSGARMSCRTRHKVQGWLFLVARNAIIDPYRTRKKTTELPVTLPASPTGDDAELEELRGAFRRLVHSLPEPYRDALVLTEFEGLSQKELAKRLGISLPAAVSLVTVFHQVGSRATAPDWENISAFLHPHGLRNLDRRTMWSGGVGTIVATTVCAHSQERD